MTKYRYNIGIDKSQIFGTEIEFSEVSLKKLAKTLKKAKIDINYQKDYYPQKTTWSTWCLGQDTSISWDVGCDILGGELSSRLLMDTEDTWKEIKKILRLTKSSGASISGYCSSQVSIDISDINNSQREQEFYKTLIEILLLYEQDMEMFYMGKKYFERQTKSNYAKSLKKILLEKATQIKHYDYTNYHDLLVYDISITQKMYGIRIAEKENSQRLEIRYPNGTLDEKILQNYINFSLKLITACKNGSLDQEQLAYLARREIKLYEEKNNSIYEPKEKAFIHLLETIATSKEDIEDFSHQYQKVKASKKEKTI